MCDRCIKRKITCSFAKTSKYEQFLSGIGDKESLKAALDLLKTLENLEQDIHQCEKYIRLSQLRSQKQYIGFGNPDEKSDSSWELVIEKSKNIFASNQY